MGVPSSCLRFRFASGPGDGTFLEMKRSLLAILFFSSFWILQPALAAPTVVVKTDRPEALYQPNKTADEMDKLATEVSTHARSLGCAHPSVVEVAATVRSSYRQFAKTSYLDYPAGHASAHATPSAPAASP